MEKFRMVETFRHGEKKGEELSENGEEQAREKAKSLLVEIEAAPNGSVFFIMPSIVGRAKMTRDIIESTLEQLIHEKKAEDIVFISIKDIEKIKEAKDDFGKKFIITDLQPSTPLGFKIDKPVYSPVYTSLRDMFKGDENYTGMTWAARRDEIGPLREKVGKEFPEIELNNVDPKKFGEPPEDAALRYLRLIKRMTELTEQFFPGHPWKSMYVGHAPSVDFASMAIMGKDISIRTIEELGGKFRDFLESARFELKDGKIIAKFRDQETEIEKDLDAVIEELKLKSADRKKEWGI